MDARRTAHPIGCYELIVRGRIGVLLVPENPGVIRKYLLPGVWSGNPRLDFTGQARSFLFQGDRRSFSSSGRGGTSRRIRGCGYRVLVAFRNL